MLQGIREEVTTIPVFTRRTRSIEWKDTEACQFLKGSGPRVFNACARAYNNSKFDGSIDGLWPIAWGDVPCRGIGVITRYEIMKKLMEHDADETIKQHDFCDQRNRLS